MKNLKSKIKFINLKKNNKKKGFTLIELVAVMAIIAVLSAAFIPKISSYIKEAQKVTVLNEAKNIVTAYEAISYKLPDGEKTTVEKLQTESLSLKDLKINKIPKTTTIAECKKILDPSAVFEVSNDGVLTSIGTSTSTTTPTE